MNTRLTIWLIPALLYAIFVFWYTDFKGPLTDKEISYFTEKIRERGMSDEALEGMAQFMREDSGRQFLMVNVIDYADNPPDVPGAEPGETAQQLMARYMDYMMPALLKRACHPVVMGNAVHRAMDLVGIDNAEHWDMGAMMRYRSRRSLLEIVANAEQKDSHLFKIAALDKTIAYPIETEINLGDPRVLLGLILLCIAALLDGRLARRQPRQ